MRLRFTAEMIDDNRERVSMPIVIPKNDRPEERAETRSVTGFLANFFGIIFLPMWWKRLL